MKSAGDKFYLSAVARAAANERGGKAPRHYRTARRVAGRRLAVVPPIESRDIAIRPYSHRRRPLVPRCRGRALARPRRGFARYVYA